jgi:hypothetical protein
MSSVSAYLRELGRRVRRIAGADLVGVYVGGSYALRAYERGRSDLDAAAVVHARRARRLKQRFVDALRHESLPCPARGLEFVLYRLDAVSFPSTAADFELNLNTGAEMEFKAAFEPNGAEEHWFPIDRAIYAQRGVSVLGPSARDVFAAFPRGMLVPVLLESIRWHESGAALGDDALLNACRAWRYAAEGVWSSKPAAGRWALQRGAPPVVGDALAARPDRTLLDPAQVRRFLLSVEKKLAAELEPATWAA